MPVACGFLTDAVAQAVRGPRVRLLWRGRRDRLNVRPVSPSSQLYQATDIHGPPHTEAVRHQDSGVVGRPHGREEPPKRRPPEIVRHEASDFPNPLSLVQRLPEFLDNGGYQQCCNDDQGNGSFGGSPGLHVPTKYPVTSSPTLQSSCPWQVTFRPTESPAGKTIGVFRRTVVKGAFTCATSNLTRSSGRNLSVAGRQIVQREAPQVE
jgi:hypothetical protein